eukprot:CAMPEP_0185521442 /NCGR_PEP_ID=MMETSP1366-20130426/79998_1 /TAXON_ID=38817 /ORGANISM="Gephyrocapsa oceanica, Strain RCC1303" /LENGTH=56 /DNA_ID=CAMNT_0028132595 /DNA_START=74 /DNA_END=240 /DNA_ORIENTATION=+
MSTRGQEAVGGGRRIRRQRTSGPAASSRPPSSSVPRLDIGRISARPWPAAISLSTS